jgi:magnesium chelatase subunit I
MGLAPETDDAAIAVACELVLESLVARRKLSRSENGRYGAAERETRRRRGRDDEA